MFSFERFLFPPQNFMLKNQQWLDKKYPFYGGQQVNKTYAEMADVVDKGWEWDPIHEYVATDGRRHQGQVRRPGQGRDRRPCSRGRTRSTSTPSTGPDRQVSR